MAATTHGTFVCEFCGGLEASVALFKKCGGCKIVRYCLKDCQRADWNTHKPRCNFARFTSLAPSATEQDASERHRMTRWIQEEERIRGLVIVLKNTIGATHGNLAPLHQYVLAVRIVPIGKTFHIQSTQALDLTAAQARGGDWVDHVDEIEGFNASRASIMDQIALRGVKYTKKDVLGQDQDSHIIVQIQKPWGMDPVPAKIQNIFQHWHTTPGGVETQSIYLIVDEYGPCPDLGISDPYRRYPPAVGILYGASKINTHLIEPEQVLSHFALTPRDYKEMRFMQVLPLNRADLPDWWLNTSDEESEVEDQEERDMDQDDSFSSTH
ncbi:hypothetical protein C8J57DRAFT_1250771 [Mycena rebaudengoi]|nr:hypothetical protein C8J57DRAFT_1250771 [Mycena rebaudengoi]